MAVAYSTTASIGFGINSITPIMASHAAGDMLLAIFSGKPFDLGVSVSGWTSLGSGTSGSTAAGVDLGSMMVQVWYKEAASSTETAPTFTEGTPAFNIAGGCVSVWTKSGGDVWETPLIAFGGDEDLGANPSCTTGSIDLNDADGIQLVIGANSDSTGPFSALAITQSGTTFGAVTEDQDNETTSGGDISMVTGHCLVTTAGSAGTCTISATGTADPGSPRMEAAMVVLRSSTPPAAPPEAGWSMGGGVW